MLMTLFLDWLPVLVYEFFQVAFTETHESPNLPVGNPLLRDPQIKGVRFDS
jgi:hypothetical protein